MNVNKDSLAAAKRQLLTVDYLSSIEASELFSQSLVGHEFTMVELFAHKTQKSASGDPIRMVKCQRVGKVNTWYLTSFLKNCKVTSVSDGVDVKPGALTQVITEQDKLVIAFKVEGFVPSTDASGNPLYSLRVYSEMKVRNFLRGAYDDFSSREWSDAKGEAINRVRSHSSELFLDDYLDAKGQLKPEIEERYRLGTLNIRALEVI